ncbi:MAG: hypothetical protein HY828_20200 [Actinobacteria bacterium]|nr:hypothetical protein [Actinomycetota bacterium]
MSWLSPPFPERVTVDEITFVPLRPALVSVDFEAVMRDIPMLRAWSAQDWPTPEFTEAENLIDLERHDREQQEGVALTYSLLLHGVVQGCLYVRPVADALITRDVVVPTPLPLPLTDVVARAWAHDISSTSLIASCASFLSSFQFPRLWWQANTDCPDQLAACDALGWTHSLTFVGASATWVLRSVPE